MYCCPGRLWGHFVQHSHAPFASSSRNHLKDMPEALSESQHVAYPHCEWGGAGRGPGAAPEGAPATRRFSTCGECCGLLPSFCQDCTDYSSQSRQGCVLSRIPRGLTNRRQEIRMGRMSFLDASVCISEAKDSQRAFWVCMPATARAGCSLPCEEKPAFVDWSYRESWKYTWDSAGSLG